MLCNPSPRTHKRGFVHCLILLGVVILASIAAPCQVNADITPTQQSDEDIAALHGIPRSDVTRLHGYRHLTNADLGQMSTARVRGVLWRLDNPRPDEPLGAAQFRRLLETGGVTPPENALSTALEQLEAVRQEATQLTAGPQPAAAAFPPSATLAGRETATVAGMPVGPLAEPTSTPMPAAAGPAVEPDPAAGRLLLRLEALPAPTEDFAPVAAASPGGGLSPGRWRWLGPGNIGGRTRSIVVHPTNVNIMWAAAVAGGIGKLSMEE